MKNTIQLVTASLAIVAGFALSQGQALAQAEKFDVTALINNRTDLEPPVYQPVGPLLRMTVHVSYQQHCPDPRLEGISEITGVWMIDMRDTPWSYVGHGKWTATLTMGGVIEGTWCVDSSGTMRSTGFISGGELDGAHLNGVSVAGSPFLGWIQYELRILLPASELK